MANWPGIIAKIAADGWEWALANPEIAIFFVTAGAGFLGWLGPRVWKRVRRRTQRFLQEDTFPFEVILPESEEILPILLGATDQQDTDPLADFNIPYQPERRGIGNTQETLERTLEQHRWLLLLAPTGIGKTREAAEVAARLNRERWTILRLKNNEWLDVPTRFPVDRIGGVQPRLLFLLDNLNQAMVLGQVEPPSNQDTNAISPLKLPLQERLRQTLQFYESACGEDRVRVIATARSEPEELEKLGLETYRSFWQQFEQFDLPEAGSEAFDAVLQQCTSAAQIPTVAADLHQIAQSNDGTFRNIVENLVKVRSRNLPLSPATFRDTLKGTWEDRYQRAVEQYPIARHIYDAVDLLRQVGVELSPIVLARTAQLLAQGNPWQQLYRRWQIHQALQYLIQNERILQPRDGQIEAKGTMLEARPSIPRLTRLLLRLADLPRRGVRGSLLPLAVSAYVLNCYPETLQLLDKLLTFENEPELLYLIYGLKGNALSALGRYEAAIACYDQALQLKPDDHQAFYNKGTALSDLGRYEAAIACYDQALQIKPDLHEAFNNKGNALSALGRYEAAIACYDQALQIKPDDHLAFYIKACCYVLWGKREEAIDWLRRAIDLYPDYREIAKTDTDFDSLRDDPDFQALLQAGGD